MAGALDQIGVLDQRIDAIERRLPVIERRVGIRSDLSDLDRLREEVAAAPRQPLAADVAALRAELEQLRAILRQHGLTVDDDPA